MRILSADLPLAFLLTFTSLSLSRLSRPEENIGEMLIVEHFFGLEEELRVAVVASDGGEDAGGIVSEVLVRKVAVVSVVVVLGESWWFSSRPKASFSHSPYLTLSPSRSWSHSLPCRVHCGQCWRYIETL